jgi:uncharacterized repeat protein (TIGR04138 family)
MQTTSFEEVLDGILKQEKRYSRDAYIFIREALDHTQRMAGKSGKGLRHVTGQELLEGIREYAIEQYGPMAMAVFEEWGIHTCRDFGELVFILVESGQLAKTDKDSREDFAAGYDFADAFRKPFIPKSRQSRPALRASATRA